jgi:CoA:oxalate CoA-transferase
MSGAMQDLLVVDFSTLLAGPWATRLMADCGAEVVKVEASGAGDLMRIVGPVVDGRSRTFAQYNRGKKSVALDLKEPSDVEKARRLMDRADVVVENFRPGVMDRLGLGQAAARARNPRLVYCSISGFGQEGPLAGAAAYAPVVHALSGLDRAVLAGEGEGTEPRAAGVMIADIVAGAYAFGAVQTALLRRERFGQGAYIDATLMESVMSLLGIQYQEAQADPPLRSTAFRPVRTADGHIIVPLVNGNNYAAVFKVIGEPAWMREESLSDPGAMAGRRREVEDALAAWAADKTAAECADTLTAAGAACARYATPGETLAHPHLALRGSFADLEDADGFFKVLNPPFRIDGVHPAAAARVPGLGEHNTEMFEETPR